MWIVIVIIFVLIAAIAYLAWIRPWQLRWGATMDELASLMAGDEIVFKPSFDATRGVSIHAPAEFIYPWIRQIGMNRAGWYSYDLLDNLARPSARNLLPEYQEIFEGQIIPMSPDGKQGLFVKEFRNNEWILWWDKKSDTSWFWGIYPAGENKSRLVTRVRMRFLLRLPDVFFNLLVEFCDIIMMRKCMLGIRDRAEKLFRETNRHSE